MSLYACILLLSIAGPFLLSFDSKVAFYKSWPAVFSGILVNALLFIPWDSWFALIGVWSFNPAYVSPIRIFRLPPEEWAFFLVIPYAGLFIYACLKSYFPDVRFPNEALIRKAQVTLQVFMLFLMIRYFDRTYTFFNALFALIVLSIQHYLVKGSYMKWFWPAYFIQLLPFLVVNGILTARPVVIYNNSETIGIRLYTIPVEDNIYALTCLLLPVMVMEAVQDFRKKQPKAPF